MEENAEICSKYNLKFTSEEFYGLWTTPYSDCVDINCWHVHLSGYLWDTYRKILQVKGIVNLIEKISTMENQ
jgi:hypothetical protein